ncbi:hypothetical protein V493_03146 [Pseudogymnoascus sp. VKM F-4281 (FW-2241)]|nr:hypothetical protein V493_03146 [Pseudogymnoascus sp. VKM F-4281 (FW-2241)]
MASQGHNVSGSKPVKSRSGRYRVKSSLFRQPPLVSDTYDDDPAFTKIFSNSGRLSTSNPSDPQHSNSTHPSSDSGISFRRERLGLYVQNYVPPPEPQYKGLQAAHKEPQSNPEPKPVDWGAWDAPGTKPDNTTENSEPVLWGGASMGDNSVQWAPTSGKGKRKKNKAKGLRSQGHFLEPPVTTIKVDIQQKGVKWRTFPINGGPHTGFGDAAVDSESKFIPWDAPETDRSLNCTDMETAGINASSTGNNADGRHAHDSHQQITQLRYGFHFVGSPHKPFLLEVSDSEEEQSADYESEDENEE